MPSDEFFKKKIAALLHDPPSKPWIITSELKPGRSHEEDAKELAKTIFDFEEEVAALLGDDDVKAADIFASSFDRWALSALLGGDYQRGAYLTREVKLYNIFYRDKPYKVDLHPPQDSEYRQKLERFKQELRSTLKTVFDKAPAEDRWRLTYNVFYAAYEYLWCKHFGTPGPADTRIPTHTVFDHTYATATTLNIIGDGRAHGYMVSVDLGGVQNYISASRKLRDLWASSWLTSALAWSIAAPFMENFGPDILILPTARGNPFYYHTLASILNRKLDSNGADAIKKAIEDAAKSAGYHFDRGYPEFAVVPATFTFILPSTLSKPQDTKLRVDGEELELSSEDNIIDFIDRLYHKKWKILVERALETLAQNEKLGFLGEVFQDLAVYDTPPLPLRVAVVEIKADSTSSKDAYLAYHKAFQSVSGALKESAALKPTPYATLNLTQYTSNYGTYKHALDEPRFYTCSMCGELPAIPRFLKVAAEINSTVGEANLIKVEEIDGQLTGERLCPYCLLKRLTTTRTVFEKVLEILTGKYAKIKPPRFPSVSSVAVINYKKALVDAAQKQPDKILQILRDTINSSENIREALASHVIYQPEKELLEKIEKVFGGDNTKIDVLGSFLLADAEDLLLVGKQRAFVNRLTQALAEVSKQKASPTTYYALIKGDGDDVGKVITGDLGRVEAIRPLNNIFNYFSNLTPNQTLSGVLDMIGHGKLEEAAQLLKGELKREYNAKELEELLELLEKNLKYPSEAKDEWKKRLPVSPAYHATISRSLMTLAVKASEEISSVGGFVVYSGGDDLLAVSPVESATQIALRVRKLYTGAPITGFLELPQLGPKTLVTALGDLGESFALTYAHYREPFAQTLVASVSALEEEAKEIAWSRQDGAQFAKDSLVVTYAPRGGKRVQARLPFDLGEKQIGKLIGDSGTILKIIDDGDFSASLVKDMDEWTSRIIQAYTKDTSLATKIIRYLVNRNASEKCDDSKKDKLELLFSETLSSTWCYRYEACKKEVHAQGSEKRQRAGESTSRSSSYEDTFHISEDKQSSKPLLKEFLAALQAEIGTRRGVES